ncbi:exodeoxyribonuclease V subunit gamma [uncultured Thiohalocapsa sp.]|uniref:exodeoxyribonuclease V subunit gamma n=1 Tax=uncultured Thiohalocapsa sp. TaxID=768990 RepID=UPI0025E851C3|nr:exodeoxyribonuclease V subunit gamma [uncultured Thiohalocapsa sp.]
MLTVIRSNRVEQLLAELARQLVAAPPASVLTPATVVAASPAMARWVNLRLAEVCGVAANLDYPLPASFVWRLARGLLNDLPDTDPLTLDAMAWQVFAELPALLSEPAFAPLQRYLQGDTDGRKRWQLAARIADVFDRCQLYRPALIRAWTQGREADEPDAANAEPWQGALWRRLVADRERQQRVAVLDRLLEALAQPQAPVSLPERVAVFAVSSLPPVLVQVFQALARHSDVDVYLHTPTAEFWSDLVSQKSLARKRLLRPDEADLWEAGNPLLGSWGRQGQALQDLLLQDEAPLEDRDAYVSEWPDTLLGRIQRDLFGLTAVPVPHQRTAAVADDSVQVHLCHSPARECQVLHDSLLALFEAKPDLRPEDVLVMVPDIARYAPDIAAVFDQHPGDAGVGDAEADTGAPCIPWNLSDIAVADEHPLVRVFLRLLALPESRFTQSEVLSYLDVPELAAQFGLDDDAVARVRDWLAASNLRWGLDGAHKAGLQLPETEQNTWAQAEARLFAGYALGGSEGFAGIAPVAGVEGAGAAALGGFWRLFDCLRDAARRLAEPRSARDWQRELGRLIADFFGERDDPDGRLQRIRDAVAELAEQAADVGERLSPALVRTWLTERAGGTATERRGGRWFSGGVTFCGMRPLRSLPFEVICVLGLNDDAFPRRDRPVEFDPLRRAWRPGDPRKADEDRYLFLETLLGARRRLYLSCVGQDIRSNQPRQPSVLLRELMDHLDQYFVAAEGEQPLSQAVTRVHPLQPFSPARFAPEHRSFDADWCRVARQVQQGDAVREAPAPVDWPTEPLPAPPEAMREVTLTQLERFLVHPVKHFVQTRLGVHLFETEPEPDDEPFALDRLAGWQLKTRLVEDRLAGRAATFDRLAAEGVLPHGALGALTLEQEQQGLAGLAEDLAPYCGQTAARLALDLTCADGPAGPWRLTGQVDGLYPELGLMRWRAGKLRGEDRLRLWLAHLARWAEADANLVSEPEPSLLFGETGRFLVADPLPQAEARARLCELVSLYRQGVQRPLPIFRKASFAFAERWDDDDENAQNRAHSAAMTAWEGNSFNDIPGDRDDGYVQLVLRDVTGDPLAHPEFARLALALYGPVLAAGADA